MMFGSRHLTENDLGRIEVRTFFALMPRQTRNGRFAWLERVVQERQVIAVVRFPSMWGTPDWTPWTTYTLDPWAEREQTKEVHA